MVNANTSPAAVTTDPLRAMDRMTPVLMPASSSVSLPINRVNPRRDAPRWLSVEHRNTVAPRVDDVLDTLMHLCASRFAVDTRHQQGVIFGLDMADGRDDGEAYSIAVQGSPGGASSHTSAVACRRMKCDRLGVLDRTTRELLADGSGELTAEVNV
jgi:hypothetical protein